MYTWVLEDNSGWGEGGGGGGGGTCILEWANVYSCELDHYLDAYIVRRQQMVVWLTRLANVQAHIYISHLLGNMKVSSSLSDIIC